MKILFLHTNFPGQFKHICKHFADLKHDVRFLCNTDYGRFIKGVQKFKIKESPSANVNQKTISKKSGINTAVSDQFRVAFRNFWKEGWNPDIVISHSGWGCGLHVKEIWPDTKLISYLEWWFNPNSETYSYDSKNIYLSLNKKSISKHWIRNANISLELATAEKIVAPSNWQKKQLPRTLQNNCEVIFDGINMDLFRSIESGSEDDKPIMTYGTRGMEPMRGFPQFIQSLPGILKAIPNLEIQIAGEDEINYGGKKAPGGKSWKEWAIAYLELKKVSSNVKWVGRLPMIEYIKWLQKSWLHLYFTHPFVPSWSLAEAICCECAVLCSDIEATKEYLIGENDLILVDHRKISDITNKAIKHLAGLRVRPQVKRPCLGRLGIDTSCYAWSTVAGLNLATEA